MAKQESEQQSNQLNLTVVALVALVAIVGLVALVMNAASIGKVATGSQMAQAESAGFVPLTSSEAAEFQAATGQNMAGAATGVHCGSLRKLDVESNAFDNRIVERVYNSCGMR